MTRACLLMLADAVGRSRECLAVLVHLPCLLFRHQPERLAAMPSEPTCRTNRPSCGIVAPLFGPQHGPRALLRWTAQRHRSQRRSTWRWTFRPHRKCCDGLCGTIRGGPLLAKTNTAALRENGPARQSSAVLLPSVGACCSAFEGMNGLWHCSIRLVDAAARWVHCALASADAKSTCCTWGITKVGKRAMHA